MLVTRYWSLVMGCGSFDFGFGIADFGLIKIREGVRGGFRRFLYGKNYCDMQRFVQFRLNPRSHMGALISFII
jgi:hypothetical protein